MTWGHLHQFLDTPFDTIIWQSQMRISTTIIALSDTPKLNYAIVVRGRQIPVIRAKSY